MKNPKHLRPFQPDQTVILVAEDEVMVRNIVRITLEGAGYFLLTAHDGQEALEISRKYPGTIHLLVSDLAMPRMGGMDLCERITKERPNIRVLLVSGNPPGKMNFPFLPKPFKMRELRAKVKELMPDSVLYPTERANETPSD